MTINSADIQKQQFKTKFRGFDIEEVDAYLERLASDVGRFSKEHMALKEKMATVEFENQGYRKREESFKRIMLNTQQTIEQMKENARKSGEIILAEAEVKAEKILNGAHNRLAQLHGDIAELKRQRMQIELQIGSIIEAHSKLLEIGKEESKNTDHVDNNVKVFK